MTVSEFNQSVDSYSDNIYRFILKNMKDEDEARDVVQDTFEKVWLKAADVAFEKAKSYLFTTAYRLMLERIRKKKRQEPIDNSLRIVAGSTREPDFDLKRVLTEALDKLSEIQRSVVMLRDYEGYSYEEIGEITGLNESQVKVYIFRARVALKNYLVSTDIVI
ncbi:MAG: RNA polymerase sigma factor [Bacteroidetes bacterium]|nr:RNA polymerase sigma factor [Bacteroidota bacterium]